ncbi:MAG: carboxymuconolactone decarboxylase family protein [Ktedonobacteraceae bacterium]|nr:carboxymuconolactone decarboxylase family protein [Ktedonobacteraceae bacterium]
MPRIPLRDELPVPIEEVAGITTMSPLFRAMAHRPEVAAQAMRLAETAMRGGTVEPKLKELLAIRVSQVNHCAY